MSSWLGPRTGGQEQAPLRFAADYGALPTASRVWCPRAGEPPAGLPGEVAGLSRESVSRLVGLYSFAGFYEATRTSARHLPSATPVETVHPHEPDRDRTGNPECTRLKGL